MHPPSSLVLLGGLASASAASAASPGDLSLVRRALPNGPSGNYSPVAVECPSTRPTARAASALSKNETSWLALRRNNTLDPLISFLTAANISGFDASSYIKAASTANVPNIGISMSGGGYRALMNGAGFLAAADSRTPDQPSAGSISGLLQASTYLAGLSGGGWLVGSMFANNFSTIVQLRDGYAGSDLWRFDNSIFSGPSDDAQDSGSSNSNTTTKKIKRADGTTEIVERGIISTADYWTDVADQVSAKADAGYETSLTDYWGRALSYQLINAPDGGLDYTFSSIALTDNFASADTPFPILVADSRAPGTTVIALNSTVYEFNAFEMGSWDPTTYGFVPTEYLGSNFSNGAIATASNSHCVRGLDQFGYVMGTSSTLFNQFLLTNLSAAADVPSFVLDIIENLLTELGDDNNDIAQWVPNPFYKYNPDTNDFANATQLTLVDGGEDLQNLPLHPLIQPIRAVDIIMAVDSSADTDYNWPNGTALRATYDRIFGDIANGTLFPAVPDDNTFVNLGLNQRPTFFGCDASNFTLTADQTVPPLVVYLPNAPFSAYGNVSTFTPSYTLAQRNGIIENGFNAATRGNGSLDSSWPKCLACAVLSRSFTRTNTTVPAECTTCFTQYCWDGTLNTTKVETYEPTLLLEGASSLDNAAASLVGGWGKAVIVATSTLLVLML
ncbi:lysophospholipase [Ophiostoma piceae UAMH 11346]|uniref:Lysophospholipase n=1 Tax=Ophiostoma piceae (strain UAMH 11346) TaxID=1262450 RepID=S3CZ11_OPHP1|nr:lysophospholipase [Ophiostoma piceae UAMH 11346]